MQLYELVNRARVTAKDAQNYIDRSLDISRIFFPMIEKDYPCGGADVARNMAHDLHLMIGRTKDAIGQPPAPLEDVFKGDDAGPPKKMRKGAADLLKDMERELGQISGRSPQALHPMLQTASIPPPLLTVALTQSATACQGYGVHEGD